MTTLRRELGLTQQELASRVGVAIRTVVRWEREAKMPVLTLPQFKRLMEVTGKNVDELIEIFGESGGRPDGRSQDGVRLKRVK